MGFSRVKLYKWFCELADDSESKKYARDLLGKDGEDVLCELVAFNVEVLERVEEQFVGGDHFGEEHPDLSESKRSEMVDAFRKICEENWNMACAMVQNQTIGQIYGSIIEKYNFKSVNITGDMNVYKVFEKLIEELNRVNKKVFRKGDFEVRLNEVMSGKRSTIQGDKNQVFLSYAFDDRLLALCLHIYMYSKGIFLYVDWLFNGKQPNGAAIGIKLLEEIKRSKQYLLMRSVNSELSIKRKYKHKNIGKNKEPMIMLRGWCAWEAGCFCGHRPSGMKEEYYLDVYSDVPSAVRLSKVSSQVEMMKKYTKIADGKIVSE